MKENKNVRLIMMDIHDITVYVQGWLYFPLCFVFVFFVIGNSDTGFLFKKDPPIDREREREGGGGGYVCMRDNTIL